MCSINKRNLNLNLIVKTYNLITGLSDHNFVLIARKLNKSRYINKEQSNKQCKFPYIPKKKSRTF